MDFKDRRSHPRIQVDAEIRVSGTDGVVEGRLVDISIGSARVILPQRFGSTGQMIDLFLPAVDGIEITVVAEVVRVVEMKTGHVLGLRFAMVEPALADQLTQLIELLLGSRGSAQRKHPRVIRRLPIRYGKLQELRAILETISLGGLSMKVLKPLSLYEEVEIALPDANNKDILVLSGRVIYQYPEEENGETAYRVGLQFRELSPVAKKCLSELLRHILELTSNRTK